MGGKRPDQYQSSPGEAEHTEYKGATDRDKVDLKTEGTPPIRSRERGRQLIPPKVPNPEVERLRALHQEQEAEDPDTPDQADKPVSSENL